MLEPDEGSPLRVCLDLNVIVAAEIAIALGRTETTPIRLMRACREGNLDLIISRRMLDRLSEVLRRPPLNLDLALATERTELLAELAALPNLLVTGTGVLPVRDVEDRGILETALAGRADYLASYNVADFEEAATRDARTGDLRYRGLPILHPAELAERVGL